MTKKEYIDARAVLLKEQKQLNSRFEQLETEFEKNKPFPEGSFVTIKLVSKESGNPYELQGYVKAWHTDHERGDFRPELLRLNNHGIVSQSHIFYSWHDDILSIEPWTPKKVLTCENSADFVEDIMYGHLPETLYVGSILDYHV